MTGGDIAARRRELLRRRLQEKQLIDESAPRGIQPREDRERARLSFAQRRMWLHQQVNPGSHAYNVSIQITLHGHVDRSALESALAGVVEAQELLRTTYHADDDGQPFQRVHPRLRPPIRFAEAEDEAHRDRLAAAEAAVAFDLESGGPIRFLLVQVPGGDLAVVLTVHHIIWDGLSFTALCRDLTTCYEQALRGTEPAVPPKPVQYADFAEWEQRNWSEPEHAAELGFWREQLLPLARTPLPGGRLARNETGERAERIDRRLPEAAASGLRRLAADQRTTTFTVFLTCYLLVLHRYTGATDITTGTTAMNRDQPELDGLVGNFGNTLALRFDLSGAPDFGTLLARVRRTCEDAYAHQNYPFELLADRLRPSGEPGKPVLFDSLALFLAQEISGPELPGITARWRTVFHGASPFPLSFQAFLTDDGLDLEATYSAELFDRELVGGMADALAEIIQRAAADPGAAVSSLVELSGPERERILARGTGGPAVSTRSVAEMFTRQVARRPDATALICGDSRLSYAQLASRAAALSRHLAELGVGPESVVAVAVPRSVDMVVAVLGVLGAGAAYLPVDPAYPAERVRFMLTDAAPTVVLTTGAVAAELPPAPGRRVLLDAVELSGAAVGRVGVSPLSAAWVGYTSGSTGKPKAVVSTHAALAERVAWAQRSWPVSDGEGRLAKSSLTFIDGSTEILETLCAGGVLALADDQRSRDGAALSEMISSCGVRHVMAVPSLLRVIAHEKGAFDGMTRVISTGEPLTAELAAELAAVVPRGALTNSYGCSELTGDVAAGAVPADLGPEATPPIGDPMPGTRAYVLDARLRLVPEGVVGELYIGGPQLARGYLGHPALTAERFVADPFGTGTRLYRTGDLARWGRAGLELLGRSDDQVKIRGNRVELGELAAAARSAPGIADAVAVTRPGPAGSLQLAVYATPQDAPVAGLRAHLERTLPGYLRPATIVALEAFPLLPNGKVDRFALPATGPAEPAPARREPRTPAERALCAVVAEVLETDEVAPEDDFFALGGDSISAISLVAKARREGFVFTVPDVFEHRTVAGLGEVATVPEVAIPLPVAAHRLRRTGFPPEEYLTSIRWRPATEVTLPALTKALRAVVARHEALRLSIDTHRRTLWRASLSTGAGEWEVAERATGTTIEDVITGAARGLDLSRGRVVRAALTGAGEVVLVANALAVDNASCAVLRDEIDALLLGIEPSGPGTTWPDPRSAASAKADPWIASLRSAAETAPARLPTGGPRPHLRAEVAGRLDDHEIVGGWLRSLRTWARSSTVVSDCAVRPDGCAVGPVTYRFPLHAGADDSAAELVARARVRFASGAGYEVLRYATPEGLRAFADLPEPGVLVTRGLPPELLGHPPRGSERHYHLVACYDRTDTDRITLDLSADPGVLGEPAVEELLVGWQVSLERMRTG